MERYSICHYPYTSIQINEDGDVHFCCHPWCSSYSIGNIFEMAFDQIWNGERAQEFRKQFIDENYKYCNLDICLNDPNRKFPVSVLAENFPESIALSYDANCNVECIFCRKCSVSQNLSKFDERMIELIPEIFKNAERVSLSGIGEALASKHTRQLMKKIVDIYPNIKFDILTNGLLMDEKNLKEVGILNNLGAIRFSFHSVKKATYDKLVKKGDFSKVMSNIDYISGLYKKGLVEQFEFRFVINSINYKEMVAYAKMAKEKNASVTFLNLINNNYISDVFEELNVINPKHKSHYDLKKILKNPIFRENYVHINQDLIEVNSKYKMSGFFEKILKDLFRRCKCDK